MQHYLRRSVWTKAAAFGFIVMILLGNTWLVFFLTGVKGSIWLSQAFGLCMAWTALAGCGMGVRMLLHRFEKDPDDDSAV